MDGTDVSLLGRGNLINIGVPLEKAIEGVVYQMVERPVADTCPCHGCVGLTSVRLCVKLRGKCSLEEYETKIWLKKEKSDES